MTYIISALSFNSKFYYQF